MTNKDEHGFYRCGEPDPMESLRQENAELRQLLSEVIAAEVPLFDAIFREANESVRMRVWEQRRKAMLGLQ